MIWLSVLKSPTFSKYSNPVQNGDNEYSHWFREALTGKIGC